METKTCSICGENDPLTMFHTLECGHSFHYQCLYLTFKNMKTNRCPYCRSSGNYLPVVNGLKKVDPKIHINDENFKNEMCGAILTRGPNKGKTCGKNCQLGFQFCKTHLKQSFKKETEKQLKG